MNIKEMHYDFKSKFNKIDSQKNRNLLVPEIDWQLNNAIDLLVNMIAFPRRRSHLGFEITQRNIDDLRTLVVKNKSLQVVNNEATLPSDYRHYIRGRVIMSKGPCQNVQGTLYIQQQDDEFEESPFNKSSFEWREVNGIINQNKISIYTEDFTVSSILLNYLKNPAKVYYGSGYNNYMPLSGIKPTQDINCDLPEHMHSEIVDIAVILTAQSIQTSDFNIKSQNLQLRDLK